jgi:hypothetical protein
LLDEVKVTSPLLVKAAVNGAKDTPNLDTAFNSLGAGTDTLRKLLLQNQSEAPQLKEAFQKDTPQLKRALLQPLMDLIAKAGNKQADTLHQETRDAIQELKQVMERQQQVYLKQMQEWRDLAARVTGKQP